MAGAVCIRLPINKDESLFGYLARVADANGYNRSTWLLPAGQTTWFDTARWTSETIKHVARITGLAPDEVAARVYADIGNDKQIFFGDRIPSILIDQRGHKAVRKFCPNCLRESGFHSALFDLVPVQICPRHARRLANACPHCRRAVFWGCSALGTCVRCDGDLRVATTEKIPTSELRGVTAIAKRLGFTHMHANLAGQNLELANELAHLSTGEILQLMITLAGFLGHRTDRASFLIFTPELRANLHSILDISLPFVQRWPEGLFQFLDLYASEQRQPEKAGYGLLRTFGCFYRFLMPQTEEPWLSVKVCFSDYLENHWAGNSIPRSPQRHSDPRSAQRFGRVSVNETSKILGFSVPKVHDLIKRAVLRATPTGNWWGAPIFVEREDIDKISPNGQKPLRLREIGRRLGISHQRQQQFLEGGVITAVLGPKIDGSKVYLINAAQADEILADFAKQLIERSNILSRSRTFAQVLQGQRLRQFPVKMLVDAIRSGRLPPVGRRDDRPGLGAYLFDRQTSILVLRRLEAEHTTKAGTDMPICSAATHLRVTVAAISEMLDAGFLQAAPRSTPGQRVTVKSIEAFQRNYVKASVLAKEHGSTPLFLTKRLNEIGIAPSSRSRGNVTNTTFYARRKLRGIEFSALLKRP